MTSTENLTRKGKYALRNDSDSIILLLSIQLMLSCENQKREEAQKWTRTQSSALTG